jgi:hypothetical protein
MAPVVRYEDCYRHAFEQSAHIDPFAVALYNAPTQKITPMRPDACRLRPRNLGSGPIVIGLKTNGKTRSCDDQHVILVEAREGADLVGS